MFGAPIGLDGGKVRRGEPRGQVGKGLEGQGAIVVRGDGQQHAARGEGLEPAAIGRTAGGLEVQTGHPAFADNAAPQGVIEVGHQDLVQRGAGADGEGIKRQAREIGQHRRGDGHGGALPEPRIEGDLTPEPRLEKVEVNQRELLISLGQGHEATVPGHYLGAEGAGAGQGQGAAGAVIGRDGGVAVKGIRKGEEGLDLREAPGLGARPEQKCVGRKGRKLLAHRQGRGKGPTTHLQREGAAVGFGEEGALEELGRAIGKERQAHKEKKAPGAGWHPGRWGISSSAAPGRSRPWGACRPGRARGPFR